MRRFFRAIAAVVAMSAAGYVGYYAYTRLTTPPKVIPGTPPARAAIPNDATDELSKALELLPDSFVPNSRSGPFLNVSWLAMHGEWAPDERPFQRIVIDYLGRPEVERAMSRLSALARSNFDAGDTDFHEPLYRRGYACDLFLLRARVRCELWSDFAGAWDDLSVALALSDTRYGATLLSIYCGAGREESVWREFIHLLREHPLPECVANAALAELALRPSIERKWHDAIQQMDAEALQFVDQTYTCDARGDGWLVLGGFEVSRAWTIFDEARLHGTPSRWWNLASFFFRTRREVTRRISRVRRGYEAVSVFDIPGVWQAASHSFFTPSDVLDGPLTLRRDEPLNLVGVHHRLICCEGVRRSMPLAIALNQYRAAHGDWPITLDALVPEYLDHIPGAILCEHPMHYDSSPDGFTLRPCRDWDGNAFPNAENSWRSLTFAGEREACNDPWTP